MIICRFWAVGAPRKSQDRRKSSKFRSWDALEHSWGKIGDLGSIWSSRGSILGSILDPPRLHFGPPGYDCSQEVAEKEPSLNSIAELDQSLGKILAESLRKQNQTLCATQTHELQTKVRRSRVSVLNPPALLRRLPSSRYISLDSDNGEVYPLLTSPIGLPTPPHYHQLQPL